MLFANRNYPAIPATVSRSVVLLSNSVIEQDGRVRKSALALHEAGWKVTTIGLLPRDDDQSPLSQSPLLWQTIHLSPPPLSKQPRTSRGARYVLSRAMARLASGENIFARLRYYYDLRLGLRLAPDRYQQVFEASTPALQQFLKAGLALTTPVHVWIANDWEMLPIGHALRETQGGALLYDTHEFATDQFSHNKTWYKWKRPLVQAVEGTLIGKADAVSSVSPGGCKALAEKYALAEKPVCIRNIPAYIPSPFRPTTPPLHCLYHGLVGPGRSLEELIASTALWRDHFRLTIRGPEGEAGYAQKLKSLVARTGGNIPISIEPPVPLDEVIKEARKADIGIMALATKSAHNQYALPNKLFEYMMAGLGLCVTGNQDMAALVQQYQNGIVLESRTPEHIAAGINALTPDKLNQFKQASLTAVKELNWENEQAILLQLMARLTPAPNDQIKE